MAKVNIAEAAKLVGKSVKTLYRHIESGKLSCVINDSGTKGVDTSELQRVYGNLNLSIDNSNNSQMSERENDMSQLLRQENEHLRELLKAKNEHIDSLNKAMLLLENKTPKEERKKGFFERIFSKE